MVVFADEIVADLVFLLINLSKPFATAEMRLVGRRSAVSDLNPPYEPL